jgi:lipoprotein-releasing system ATP-binding protein
MLEVQNLSKEYPAPGSELLVLSGISLSLNAGDAVSIVGPSGSGKSTLLYILGAMETPTSGTVVLEGRNPHQLNGKDLAAFRNEKIGFVFQDHHLLPQCTVLENVLIPTLVSNSGDPAQHRALELLERVGLSSRLHYRPHELSGGEKQRVALARALIMGPRLILCDEPTGNLDHASTDTVMSLLFELHKMQQGILIVVTHNMDIAQGFALKYKLTGTRLHVV